MGVLCKAVAALVDGAGCNLRKRGSRRIFMFESDVLDPFL